MKEMRARVRRITEDLNCLLQELTTSQEKELVELIEEILTAEMMQHFKASVDAMRHLLWIYIEAASRVHHTDLNDQVRSLRLQRAAAMLRNLREGGVPISSQFPEGKSFIEQVDAVVDYYTKQSPGKTSKADRG